MHAIRRRFIFVLFALVVSTVLVSAAQRGGEPGQAPAGQRGGQQGAGRGQRGGQQAPPEPTGLTVTGEVQNYVPVTDAMLRNPDPGDWLMIRRDYHASDYSPLNQITRDNAKDLQLVFKSPMHEG